MGFLDDLLKDVEKGIDRVAQGADKLLSESNIRSELDALNRDQQGLLAEIGEEAVALYAAGEIQLPGMNMQIAQLRDIRSKITEMETQLTQAQGAAPPRAATPAETVAEAPAAPAPDAESASSVTFCAECGARLTEGVAFCPECGNRVT